jgi:alpha-mannosidase
VRALPVLIIAGSNLGDAVADLVDDLADAEVAVAQNAPSQVGEFENRTVAVVNRGMPGFAVDSDGTLHMSLLRSCTGWPSGTWIDPPRRTAPDGSNFQLQHWTHTFDYAMLAGDGDWRDAGMPARSAEFCHPLIAVAENTGAAGGLPSWGSLLDVEPAGRVQLAALKAAGNPLAAGSIRAVDPADGVAVRVVETRGAATDVVVRSGLRRVSAAMRADLLEQPRVHGPASEPLRLHGYEIATVLTRLNMPKVLDADHAMLAPEAEPAQPLYARYWLHNRGPAPLGGLPVVAHLHPQHVAAEPDSEVALRLTVVSDCSDAIVHGKVRLLCPDGCSVEPADLPFMLPPGDYLDSEIVVRIPPGSPAGLYPIRAELAVTGSETGSVSPAWRQTVEDVCIVSVGSAADTEVMRLVSGPDDVIVKAGDTTSVGVTVGTDAWADLAVEAHAISPWGTWEWLGPKAIGAEIPARGNLELAFDVSPPAWIEPGQWWALIRLGCAGRLIYSPAVKVVVR